MLARYWRFPPVDLYAPGQDVFNGKVAVDSAGNAIAVWEQSTGTNFIIQASRFSISSSSWSAVTNLSDTGGNAFNPQVAMDSDGNAIAVWEQSTGTNNGFIQASRFSISSSSWSAVADVANLSEMGENAYVPQVAMDSAGNAIAVWSRSDETNDIIQASRFSISSGSWSAVADVANLSDTGGYALDPQVAMDSAGNAIAVWYQRTGTNTIIQASRFSGSSWSAVTDLSAPGQDALDPQVAMDSDGNAIAVWSRYDGTNIIIQAIQYK
jgi:hypothetical protein